MFVNLTVYNILISEVESRMAELKEYFCLLGLRRDESGQGLLLTHRLSGISFSLHPVQLARDSQCIYCFFFPLPQKLNASR